MQMRCCRWLLVLVVSCLVGCGSPTKQFEEFVAKSKAKLDADQRLRSEWKFPSVRYDVRKTDSMVSPYVAEVVLDAINVPRYADDLVRQAAQFDGSNEGGWEYYLDQLNEVGLDKTAGKKLIQDARAKIPPQEDLEARQVRRQLELALRDDGSRKYAFQYAYKDGSWEFRGIKSENPKQVVDMPQPIIEAFRP